MLICIRLRITITRNLNQTAKVLLCRTRLRHIKKPREYKFDKAVRNQREKHFKRMLIHVLYARGDA